MKGTAFKFGDDISTDHIAPGRLYHLRSNLPEFAKHVLEDADETFASRMKKGDFVVVETARGMEFGTITMEVTEIKEDDVEDYAFYGCSSIDNIDLSKFRGAFYEIPDYAVEIFGIRECVNYRWRA